MTFKAKPKAQETKKHITVNLPSDKYALVAQSAKESGVSIKEFCRQAVAYAMGWK